jgi:hypothetical protein
MLDGTKMRALPVVNRAADLAPAAQACCGVCRTCAATNVITLATAAAAAMFAAAARNPVARRFRRGG